MNINVACATLETTMLLTRNPVIARRSRSCYARRRDDTARHRFSGPSKKSATSSRTAASREETLDNIVQLIQRTLRHRRVFGLSARARSVDARARRNRRPASRQRRARAHAAERRPGGPGRRAADAAGRRGRHHPSALQVLQRGGRRSVSLVPRRAAHRQGAAAGRARRADDRASRLRSRRRAHADDGRNAARARS